MPHRRRRGQGAARGRRRPSGRQFVRRVRFGSIKDEAAEEDRLTASLAGLAVALLVVVAGLFLIQHLRDKARIEDCLMAGRSNCDAVLGSALR